MSTIHIQKSHEGLLHRKLGIPQGDKIPVKTLEKAKHSSSPELRREAAFAMNARHFDHKK